MKVDIEKLLTKKGYFPLETGSWSSFEFNQSKPKNDAESQNNIKKIEAHVTNKEGVYVYINDKNEVLYVGKGSPIKKRLISHYKKLSKSNLNNRIAFFQDNPGIVNIHWLEIEEKEEREIVEHLLAFLLTPKYSKWRCV